MAYDAKFLRLPGIHWLGVFPSDGEKYGIPQQCHLPLTAEGEMDTFEKAFFNRILDSVSCDEYILIACQTSRELKRCC